FLQKVAQAAFAVLGIKEEVSLVFIGDAKMKELNKKYRGKNKTTDVLSFKELSEIFICLSVAKKQAKLLKTGLKSELTRLLTHGIVHLQGYDHAKSAREAERMFEVEEKILLKLRLKAN
ncbi:MAG: rRNA maturation RNase YbeY, partial [Gammaproteobacteria bacterium RIFCSPLOWO2_02_FULL_42_9]